MAWIEVHQELRDHPKITRLSEVIKCSKAEAIGYMVSLWLWAVAYSKSGDLSDFTDFEIADACNYQRDERKKFVASLVQVGFLDSKDEKKSLHDWKKHGLRILEQSRKRVAKSRRNKDLSENDVAQPLRDGSALLSLYLSNHSNLSNLSTEAFKVAVEEWIIFRREKRKPLTETMLLKQFDWLATQVNPTECINQSIRNGWQGLFEVKDGSKQSTSGRGYRFDADKYRRVAEAIKPKS